jgi:molybdopterin-containing oxidoreductase family iron-sulfur binding subunit
MASKNPKEKEKEKEKSTPILTRSDFLKIGGATLGAAVLSELVISGPFSPEAIQGIGAEAHPHQGSAEHQWHMAIDLDRCIGCLYCVRACQAVNDVPDDEMRWNVVFPERLEDGTEFFMNRPCQHCQEAPCVRVCPVGATWVRPDGIVAMDYDRCIGCRYCQVACPYDVRRFNWKTSDQPNPYQPTWGVAEVPRRPRGVVEKCTFCVHRIDRGLEQGLKPGVDRAATPACVVACPVGARIFGDIRDPESPISRFLATKTTFRLREDWGTEPKVHYVRPTKKEA